MRAWAAVESVAICYWRTTSDAGGFLMAIDASDEARSQTGSADVLRVSEVLAIPRSEIVAKASRAGGPGGQHVNTSSTRIELTWNVAGSAVLTDAQRARLIGALGRRIGASGAVRVVSSEMRSQRQNRERAERRLAELVAAALVVRKRRKATKPSRAAKQARLDSKKQHSRKKDDRRRDAGRGTRDE